jgi:hypothetical protein
LFADSLHTAFEVMEYDENDDRHQMLEIFKNLSIWDPGIYKDKQKNKLNFFQYFLQLFKKRRDSESKIIKSYI